MSLIPLWQKLLTLGNCCDASYKSEAKQSRLIDDQLDLVLMRPCCPRLGPDQDMQDFLLNAPSSLILFGSLTAAAAIVGFNYFTNQMVRMKDRFL